MDEKENSSQPFEVQGNELKKAKGAYEEVIIDSSKYYERFMEGWSFVEFLVFVQKNNFFFFNFIGLSLSVNTLISSEKSETMKNQDCFLEEPEEEKKEFDILPDKEDVEKLFQAELKQMIDVILIYYINIYFF